MEIIKELPDEIVLWRAVNNFPALGPFVVAYMISDVVIPTIKNVLLGQLDGKLYYPLIYINNLDAVGFCSFVSAEVTKYTVVDIGDINKDAIDSLRGFNYYTFIETSDGLYVANSLDNYKIYQETGNVMFHKPYVYPRHTSVDEIIVDLKKRFVIKKVYRPNGFPVSLG